MTTIPRHVWRLWMPCDIGAITPANQCGFHQPVLDKGWDRVWSEGLGWGEVPVDELLPHYPNLAVFWSHGAQAESTAPIVGKYPAAMGGGNLRCSPRGPEMLGIAEQSVPGFWPALKPRIAAAHSRSGRVMVYYGLPPLSLFPQNASKTQRNAILDALINPAIEAGMGANDIIACDACAPTTQTPAKTDGMYFAERVVARGIGFCNEAHEVIHPELYPWFNGRFSALSARYHDPAQSRWDVASGPGWFGPDCGYALKEHFCCLTGSVPIDKRPGLIVHDPQRRISTIMEMNDLPRSSFDMALLANPAVDP